MVRPTAKDMASKTKQLPRLAWIAATSLFLLVLVVAYHKKSPSSTSSSSSSGTVTHIRSINGESPWFALLPDDEYTPHIVWLLTMPNAGTAFAMTLVQRATNHMMATNYGDDVTSEGAYSLSIYPRHVQGPYWTGLGASKLGLTVRTLPEDYVMVQTHCLQTSTTRTLDDFMDDCRQTYGRTAPDASVLQTYHYPTERVKKVIHLVRNPYKQIVANFVQEYKERDTEWRKTHSNNNEGLVQWCHEQADTDMDSINYPRDLYNEMQGTTCHTQVAQYVEWHNMAIRMETKLQLETLVVHYEDFNATATLDKMVDFLKLEKVMTPSQKIPADDDYDAYFTSAQREEIRHLVKIMAMPETWRRVKQYFE